MRVKVTVQAFKVTINKVYQTSSFNLAGGDDDTYSESSARELSVTAAGDFAADFPGHWGRPYVDTSSRVNGLYPKFKDSDAFGGLMLRTHTEDKFSTVSKYVNFSINAPARVFVFRYYTDTLTNERYGATDRTLKWLKPVNSPDKALGGWKPDRRQARDLPRRDGLGQLRRAAGAVPGVLARLPHGVGRFGREQRDQI